ncbi:hypothetical protein ACHAXA_000782 [Cyclostephanos tholiformis]|uniref:Uncharacterized protein n=1 Tax=Cyclostephanos tholiformis TaxID=382380 RepID=A0ABD3R1Z7_9STRA
MTTSPETDDAGEGASTDETGVKKNGAATGDEGGDDVVVEGEVKPTPQSQEEGAAKTGGGDGEMYDLRLSPLDYQNQRQSLMNTDWSLPPTPYLEGGEGGGASVGGEVSEARSTRYQEEESALHRDEFAEEERKNHDPRNRESALGSAPPPPPLPSSFKRNTRRLNPGGRTVAPGRGGGRHSHPRKSPYRSEVARLRHAQQQEQIEGVDEQPSASGGSAASVKSISIKDTTAPPDTAYFSIQSAKLKHAILDSLGDFLTGAFADDEETGGSYFSQDLLDQLSASNPYLRGVWLQAKNLNDDHVRRLCDALIRNKVVTEVWLPSNRITDVGAGYIAHMLKFNRHIKELFLGENDIGPKGAAALASALARGNNTLVALGLGDNHIGVEGAGAFAAALRHNHSLQTLDVKNNGIPSRSSIRSLLHKMLEFNSSDPGDESLVLGLQEELVKLVTSLPSDVAESIVVQAEDALKLAMLCRRRGDNVGAAEAEGIFIRICTTGIPGDPSSTGGMKDGLGSMGGGDQGEVNEKADKASWAR